MIKTKVKAPAPSKAEQALQKQQAALLKEQQNILKQQQANQNALMQFAASNMGLKITFDSKGNIKSFTDIDPEATAAKARQREIQKLEEERSLAALRGELEVDPTLERNLAEQEQTLRERLEAQFGAGYETATPAIETLDKFFQSAESLRYGARTGQLTLAEQLALARQNANEASGMNQLSAITQSTLGAQLGLAGAYGSAAAGYGAAQKPYQFNRELQFNANMQSANNFNNFMSGLGSLAGTALFSPLGGTAASALFSDRSLKDNIIKVGDTFWGGGIYIYTLKGSEVPRLGLMADEVLEARPDAVSIRDGYLTVNYGAL